MNKIKIDVKQASEFMKLGYEIECHVLVPKVKQEAAKRSINTVIPATARLMLSLENEGPVKGAYQGHWKKLKERLWINGDLTVSFTRAEIEKELHKINPKLDPGFFTYLVNNKQCLRVVD